MTVEARRSGSLNDGDDGSLSRGVSVSGRHRGRLALFVMVEGAS